MRIVALRARSAALILARARVRVWLHNILNLIYNNILQLKYILIFTFFVQKIVGVYQTFFGF